MSTSIRTSDPLEPGAVVILDRGGPREEWVRVLSVDGDVSWVTPLGRWERRWLILRGHLRGVFRVRLWWVWMHRVWWPVSDWLDERRRS